METQKAPITTLKRLIRKLKKIKRKRGNLLVNVATTYDIPGNGVAIEYNNYKIKEGGRLDYVYRYKDMLPSDHITMMVMLKPDFVEDGKEISANDSTPFYYGSGDEMYKTASVEREKLDKKTKSTIPGTYLWGEFDTY
jgi:hypothetical protein